MGVKSGMVGPGDFALVLALLSRYFVMSLHSKEPSSSDGGTFTSFPLSPPRPPPPARPAPSAPLPSPPPPPPTSRPPAHIVRLELTYLDLHTKTGEQALSLLGVFWEGVAFEVRLRMRKSYVCCSESEKEYVRYRETEEEYVRCSESEEEYVPYPESEKEYVRCSESEKEYVPYPESEKDYVRCSEGLCDTDVSG